MLTGIAGLLACGSAMGAIIYDLSTVTTLDFSHPWVSVEHITTPSPFPFCQRSNQSAALRVESKCTTLDDCFLDGFG